LPSFAPQLATEGNLFGQAPHTDNSLLTVLARNDRANDFHQKGHRSEALDRFARSQPAPG
jgi:hypothetical protein